MSANNGYTKCNKIRHIVRLRQMLQRWRQKAAAAAAGERRTPLDVPAGHVAISVGRSCRRFVVRATYLNHPVFQKLLVEAEEEYGFTNSGPLTIPCDESLFEDILRFLSRGASSSTKFSNSSSNSNSRFDEYYCHHQLVDFRTESRPLLHLHGGLLDNTIW